MKNPSDDLPAGRQEKQRRALPFFVEFVKFSAGFSLLIALALIALNAVSAFE